MNYPENEEQLNNLPVYENEYNVKDLYGWADDWYNSILPEQNKLSLKFEKWNKEFKGKLRGKLVPVIGYGGTKKSLLGLNIAQENIYNNFGRCLYSSMEMGATEIINRLIDMSVEPADGFNPHSELEYHNNRTKKIKAKEYYKNNIVPIYKDRLFITESTAMETLSFDKILNRLKQKGAAIDILVVDGLAGMGGKGSETELYSKHSKELKDLANKWKILVLLICHVSKGGKKTDRDLSQLIRSSEKIIDNCDFYITTSLFKNGDDEYDTNHGALRLINKRGSGNTLDVVYSFDRLRLLMEDTEMEFNQFD